MESFSARREDASAKCDAPRPTPSGESGEFRFRVNVRRVSKRVKGDALRVAAEALYTRVEEPRSHVVSSAAGTEAKGKRKDGWLAVQAEGRLRAGGGIARPP